MNPYAIGNVFNVAQQPGPVQNTRGPVDLTVGEMISRATFRSVAFIEKLISTPRD